MIAIGSDRDGRWLVVVAAVACALGLALLTAPSAFAAYGDDYGIAPINDNPDAQPNEDVPALPGEDYAFWAGTCDILAAPPTGESLVPLGGIGTRPASILVPNRGDALIGAPGFPSTFRFAQVAVNAPVTPDHCIDWGAYTAYGAQHTVDPNAGIWQSLPWGGSSPGQTGQMGTGPSSPSTCGPTPPCDYAPSWRLPAVTQAGAHPDGTTTFAWARNSEGIGASVGSADGSPDNIVVDLPPGFVANPQAVPMCTSEQFDSSPLECPPASQVGILRLNVEGVGGPAGGTNLGSSYDTTYPVFNLEPRQGRVAELGFGYASGFEVVTVRLTGKARTNNDFEVTAFTGQIPAALLPIAQSITIWGVPWAAAHDVWRPILGQRPGSTGCNAQPGTTNTPKNYIPPGGLPTPACRAHYDPSWDTTSNGRTVRPFLSNETDCNSAPTVKLATDSFQHPGAFTPGPESDPALDDGDWKRYESTSPPVTGCDQLAFQPDIEYTLTDGGGGRQGAADGASGLRVDLAVPQNNDPKGAGGAPLEPPAVGATQTEIDDYIQAATDFWDSPGGRATAHLKDSVVTLPPGVRVNPSGATGLRGCSDAGIGIRGRRGVRYLFNNGDPFNGDGGADGAECPQESIIGTAEVDTPLLEEKLTGQLVLGQPLDTNPQSGNMLRMFIVVRLKERGLIAKIFGSAKADGQVGEGGTGQLTATFLENPEVPFDQLSLEFKAGPRGLLAAPQRCGAYGWSAAFTPWSSVGAPTPAPASNDGGAFPVDANCGFGFSPSLNAGMDNRAARASGSFAFEFTRSDGQQWVKGLTAKLPTGLLASVRDLPLCTNAQASAGACPAASRLGSVDAAAGSGDPFVLEQKGDIYLTEGYKGGEYGLMVKVRAIAGPFRDNLELTSIVVRQAIHVDRTTAQVTAISDPFPTSWHGVPLGVRRVTVTVDRPEFMRNPSDCSPKQVEGSLVSAEGAVANLSTPFQASGCAGLRFRPRLALRLTGRKQVRTGKHPGVNAVVRQAGIAEAGIGRAEVRLPKSLALDPENAQALCEFEDGTKPDLESHCPKGSIVGRARAVSPLLNDPLVGNVYFVKNVRRDPQTGNEIRTLPMIIVALRGEIAVNLRGESDTTKAGKLVNTFDDVPDAPITRFNLNIKGGKNGILAVTRTRRARINLCSKPKSHVAEADMDGQNGKRFDRDIRMKTPCTRKQIRAAKRKAQRAAKRKQRAVERKG